MADSLVIHIDVDSSEALAATSAYGSALQKVDANLARAAIAQSKYDAAVAKSGASSDAATAAQMKLGAALARTTEAETRAGIAAARAGEVQARASAKAAAAAEAAAAKESAAAQKVAAAQEASMAKRVQVAKGFGLATVVAFGLAAKASADFNSKLATLQSLDPSADVGALADAAKTYANLGISATSAADAEIELMKAGIGVKDQLGGALTGTLNLAAAGQMNVADATQIAAAAMTAFGLSGKDIPHVADLLAAGADKALGSVGDLGEGLKYSALPAHQLGVSVDETVSALAEFAQAGLIGSQGGTALQMMFQRLIKPTKEAQTMLDQYGISLYDAKGGFVGMADLAGQLHDKLGGLSLQERETALATIFSARAARGAAILYQDGADGVLKWQENVEASGFAAQQAAGKMDSLSGDLEKLKAKAVNAGIAIGDHLQGPLREVVGALSGLIDVGGDVLGFLNRLPGPIKAAAVALIALKVAGSLGIFTAIGSGFDMIRLKAMLAGDAVSAASKKMIAARVGAAGLGAGLFALSSSLDSSHQSIKDLSGAAGMGLMVASVNPALGAVVGFGMALHTAIEQNGFKASAAMDQLTTSIEKVGTAGSGARMDAVSHELVATLTDAGISVDQYNRALAGSDKAYGNIILKTRDLGLAAELITHPIDDAREAQQKWVTSMQETADKAGHTGAAIHAMGGAVDEFGRTIPGAGDALKGYKDGADGAAGATRDFAAALKALDDALLGDQGVLSQRADWASYKESVAAASAELKKNGTESIKAGTAAGTVLDNMASSAIGFSKNLSGHALTVYMQKARSDLYQVALGFTGSKEAARDYVNQVLGIPETAKTRADIDTQAAMSQIKALQTQYHLTPAQVKTIVTAAGATTAAQQVRVLRDYINQLHSKTVEVQVNTELRTTFTTGGHTVVGNAAGDIVRGPGTGTSDSILRRVSNGEAITRASIVNREGPDSFRALNAGRATIVPLRGFANGGLSGRSFSGGASRTVYMTDPALLDEIRNLRQMLDQKGLAVRNPGAFDGRARGIARDEVTAQGRWASR